MTCFKRKIAAISEKWARMEFSKGTFKFLNRFMNIQTTGTCLFVSEIPDIKSHILNAFCDDGRLMS